MNEEWKDILGQPVGIVDCDGNLLYSFGSLREAESKIGVSRFGITAACNGIQQSAGGIQVAFPASWGALSADNVLRI